MNVEYTSDMVRVVHGYWIFEEYPDGYYHWECSKCGSQFSDGIVDNADEEWKYCPKCGAKMDEYAPACGPDYCEI